MASGLTCAGAAQLVVLLRPTWETRAGCFLGLGVQRGDQAHGIDLPGRVGRMREGVGRVVQTKAESVRRKNSCTGGRRSVQHMHPCPPSILVPQTSLHEMQTRPPPNTAGRRDKALRDPRSSARRVSARTRRGRPQLSAGGRAAAAGAASASAAAERQQSSAALDLRCRRPHAASGASMRMPSQRGQAFLNRPSPLIVPAQESQRATPIAKQLSSTTVPAPHYCASRVCVTSVLATAAVRPSERERVAGCGAKLTSCQNSDVACCACRPSALAAPHRCWFGVYSSVYSNNSLRTEARQASQIPAIGQPCAVPCCYVCLEPRQILQRRAGQNSRRHSTNLTVPESTTTKLRAAPHEVRYKACCTAIQHHACTRACPRQRTRLRRQHPSVPTPKAGVRPGYVHSLSHHRTVC